jgi:hypothetical protein
MLTVVSFSGREGNANYWLCGCECGGEKIVRAGHLLQDKIRSCGCLTRASRSAPNKTHGMSLTPEYQSWKSMKDRCLNKRNRAFKHYGGRGITVCDRWIKSFEDFYSDMGPRPSPRHSLDRYPDNNGNYEPGNCRWATSAQQRANQRPYRARNQYHPRNAVARYHKGENIGNLPRHRLLEIIDHLGAELDKMHKLYGVT